MGIYPNMEVELGVEREEPRRERALGRRGEEEEMGMIGLPSLPPHPQPMDFFYSRSMPTQNILTVIGFPL